MKFRTSLAVMALAFFASSPLLAADNLLPGAAAPKMPSAPQAPVVEKPDLAGTLKQKASDAVEKAKSSAVDKAKTSMENKTGELKQPLDGKKAGLKEEMVDVTKETVTVETPSGVSQETTVTVTPETPAVPAPAGK